MGKISGYTIAAASLSDMLTGTDITDNYNTKNFLISSVLSLPLQDIGTYVDNAAAVAAGLAVGKIYRITGTDHAGIVHA